MANVNAPPPGGDIPQGMLAQGNTTTPREHIFRIEQLTASQAETIARGNIPQDQGVSNR